MAGSKRAATAVVSSRAGRLVVVLTMLVVVPAVIGTLVAGPSAGAALPVGVVVSVLCSMTYGRRAALGCVPLLVVAGFLAALTAGTWPWVVVIGVVAGIAGWAVPSGRSGPLAVITLIVITVPGQPDVESAVVFAGFLGLGAALGLALAARMHAPEEVERPRRGGRPLVYMAVSGVAVAIGGALGVALGWERAYWVPLTIVVLGQVERAEVPGRAGARLLGTMVGVVIVVPLVAAVVPAGALSVLGVVVMLVALSIDPSPYWRFVALLTAGVVLLLTPASGGGIDGIALERFWATVLGVAIISAAVALVGAFER
ncbi:MAG: FUSC family protein [Ilumatobacteraceae bacterium]